MFKTPAAMNANINGPAMQLRNMFGYSIQAEFTATPTGTLALQGSCDPIPDGPPDNTSQISNQNAPVNWTTIINSPLVISASGNYVWNVSDVQYNWVRLIYTDSSGGTSTATLTAIFNGKGI